MNSRIHSTLAALLVGAASLSSAYAAYQGTKGSVTLTLTATSEIGGFYVTNKSLPTEAAKGISYEEWSIQNPPGFNAETAAANYYSYKLVTKEKNYGTTGEGEDFRPTSIVSEESFKQHSQTLSNASIIKELVARGYAPQSALSGHRLVAVFPADRPESDEAPPVLFFLENDNASSILYVGRETNGFGSEDDSGYEASADDGILLSFGNGVETYTHKTTTTFSHQRVSDGEGGMMWEFDDEGTTTRSESFSGKVRVYVDLFPGYYDSTAESYINTGASYHFDGLLSFSGKLETFKDQDPSNDLFITTSAALSDKVSAGSFYADYDDEYGYYQTYGITTGGFSISKVKTLADITPYLDAIPERLSTLKQAIIDSYSSTPDDSPDDSVDPELE